ncbi:MAG: hypothetical protein RLZZ561_337 [Pseudomonadota bacterium]|jgi:2-dehydro-3-deoxyphosphogalactonate aldolase
MASLIRFQAAISDCPLIAILRGLAPDGCEAIGEALVSAGICMMEVPLNGPEPLTTIERLVQALGERAIIGAGTVLDPIIVPLIHATGAQLIVSPNVDDVVISATIGSGLISIPGYFTPSEAFQAARAGAHGLKFFPAEAGRPEVIKAQKAVLPQHLPVFIVGGVAPSDIPAWQQAGADGFGIGSQLYKPGDTAKQVHVRARAFVKAVKNG